MIYATPWFTGPLYANWGIVAPVGHGYWRVYGDNTLNYGIYDNNHNFIKTPHSSTDNMQSILGYGLTKDVDTQLFLMYLKNKNEGQAHSNLGDTTITLGFQLMRQEERQQPFNLRLTIGELFPTGRYDRLNPSNDGTDATGGGSYLTNIGLHFQHLAEISETHSLCTRGSIIFTYASNVPLHGFSAYGGSPLTTGTISPGNALALNLSGEYSLTQNWVAVMEGFLYAQQASTFTGRLNAPVLPNFQLSSVPGSPSQQAFRRIIFNRLVPTTHNIGGQSDIGNGNISQFTLAPAIEYNFTSHLGVIGGAWFSVLGKNMPAFVSSALALTITW